MARDAALGPACRGDLFAYGTLRFPEVLSVLLGRVPASRDVLAPGWRAARLRGLSYPGLVAGGGPASGVLLSGLSAQEWQILDAYEDDEYDLIVVGLAGAAGLAGAGGAAGAGVARTATAYRYTNIELVLPDDWSAAEFAVRHLPTFIKECHYWRIAQVF